MAKNPLTLGWIKVLKDHGINTVPMSSEQKMPLIQTSQYWSGFPLSAMNDLQPKNIAALPGLASRLLVLDLDGPQDMMRAFFQDRPALPRTWQVSTGGGGLHLWLRLPHWYKRPIPNVRLWQGTGKHEEILVLGDRRLASCPPTQYGSGKMYKWTGSVNPLTGKCGIAPQWLLGEIEDKTTQKKQPFTGSLTFSASRSLAPSDEIPERLSILQSYGLRLAGKPNQAGWIPCYRPGDPNDSRPSASVRIDGSVVWTSGGSMDFWGALVALHAFDSIEAAVAAIRGI